MGYAIFPPPVDNNYNYNIVMSSDGLYYIDHGMTRRGPYKNFNSAEKALLKELEYKEVVIASYDEHGNKL